jgi:hypothetical protein
LGKTKTKPNQTKTQNTMLTAIINTLSRSRRSRLSRSRQSSDQSTDEFHFEEERPQDEINRIEMIKDMSVEQQYHSIGTIAFPSLKLTHPIRDPYNTFFGFERHGVYFRSNTKYTFTKTTSNIKQHSPTSLLVENSEHKCANVPVTYVKNLALEVVSTLLEHTTKETTPYRTIELHKGSGYESCLEFWFVKAIKLSSQKHGKYSADLRIYVKDILKYLPKQLRKRVKESKIKELYIELKKNKNAGFITNMLKVIALYKCYINYQNGKRCEDGCPCCVSDEKFIEHFTTVYVVVNWENYASIPIIRQFFIIDIARIMYSTVRHDVQKSTNKDHDQEVSFEEITTYLDNTVTSDYAQKTSQRSVGNMIKCDQNWIVFKSQFYNVPHYESELQEIKNAIKQKRYTQYQYKKAMKELLPFYTSN